MSLISGPAVGAHLDDLTPTESLLLDVVTSRYLLGHGFWAIERRHRKALDALAEKGLVTYESGTIETVYDVSATRRGLALCLTTLTSPALDPRCRSAYFGPMSHRLRVDCERASRHGGKHRAPFGTRGQHLKWTDEQAWGADDPYWSERLTQSAALFADPDPCVETLDYKPYGITVDCGMPNGHDTRHLWPGDRTRPWIKPVAWDVPFKRPHHWAR